MIWRQVGVANVDERRKRVRGRRKRRREGDSMIVKMVFCFADWGKGGFESVKR